MTTDPKCPHCGRTVPEPRLRFRHNGQRPKQFMMCKCGKQLERNADPPGDTWRVQH